MTAGPTARDELLRPVDVAAEYGICESTQASWRARGIGPAWQHAGPRRIVYRRSELDRWLEQERARTQAAS